MISFIVKIKILSGNIKKNKTILRDSIRGSKKYLDQCRNKVREIVTRGYAQYEIANIWDISQTTISRDIHYLQKEIS